MGFRDAINQALAGWRQGMNGPPTIAVAQKQSAIQSAASATRDAMIARNPTLSSIPSSWTDFLLGPGLPVAPIGYSRDSYNAQVAENEPRSNEYIPNVNAQITPRIGWGHMPFSLLKYYGENVPEVALCRRLRIAALTDFVPQILGPDGQVVQKAQTAIARDKRGEPIRNKDGTLLKTFTGKNETEIAPDLGWLTTHPLRRMRPSNLVRKYSWCDTLDNGLKIAKVTDEPPMTEAATTLEEIQWEVTRPDRFNAWPIWLSRFMYNVIVYDAGCVYRVRDRENRIIGLRVIDGSTIFCIVDQRSELPAPPAPAFSQIIWGTPRQWYNTYQLWYRPRQQRPNSPYGITAVEDALSAVQFLDEFWRWWLAEYQQGNMPRAWFKPGQGVTPEKAEEFTRAFNNRTSGNYDERARIQAIPSGWDVAEVKDREWRGPEYEAARDEVALTMGIHPTELGKAPSSAGGGSSGLGGKGYQEKGEQAHARIGPGPDKEYVEGLFNDILLEMAEDDPRLEGHTWQLAAPDISIDPNAEREYRRMLWINRAIKRGEYRNMEGLELVGDESDDEYYEPKSSGAPMAADAGGAAPVGEAEDAPAEAIPAEGEAAGEVNGGAEKLCSNFSLNGHTADFEKAWNITEIAKHCGVCPEDDDYFGAPVARETTVLMPVQGANDSEIVALKPANLEPRPAVWKPEGGEDDGLSEAIGGPQYAREEATYILDRVLKFRLVPVAYVAEVDSERGAAIMYVRGNEPRQDASQYAFEWVGRAAALDYVIGQCDRRFHNWLTHPDDDTRPILIDNGLTFPQGDLEIHSAFVNVMVGQAFSAPIIAALRKCMGNVEWRDIESLVGHEATDRAKERCRALVEAGTIPIPAEEHHAL